MLQARENLMGTIQAFLKEYDHIPPEEKCMALLLAKERFLKIKQAVEEEQNQPEVMQELLLKLMNDLQILKGIQPKQAEQAAKSFTPYGNFSMIDDVKILLINFTGIDEDDFDEEEGENDNDILQIERTRFLDLIDFLIEEVDTFLVQEDSITYRMTIPSIVLDFSHVFTIPWGFSFTSSSPGDEATIFDPRISTRASVDLIGRNFSCALNDYPDFEDSRAHGFVHSFELHILSFI
ncbi:hypothetical protein Tco_0121786 [Tanacetum coccineum]